jgi:dienelactone hydrolase
MRKCLLRVLTVAIATITTLAGTTYAANATTVSGHFSGTLADGATWIADVPTNWNGTLVLYSHGFGPLQAADAPDSNTASALLSQGYALAGSSYNPYGSQWALGSAENDQFATLSAFGNTIGRPARTLSMGESMGGLVNAQIARDGGGQISGSLNLCGLVAGGVDLVDYQLASEEAINVLLDPQDQMYIQGMANTYEAQYIADKLTSAVQAAQNTPQGRARIALAAALLNTSGWYWGENPPTNPSNEETQQYQWLTSGMLSTIVNARYTIEQAAGGGTGTTAGLNWGGLLSMSWHQQEVQSLYTSAGLNINNDLATLQASTPYYPSQTALSWMQQHSTAGQYLAVPLLDLHTTSDQLVPVEHENAFATRVSNAGSGWQLRQAYVARQGHCNFTTNEILAGVQAVMYRINTGGWGDTSPGGLNNSQPYGTTSFVNWSPGKLVTRSNL